jgi:hypothetical protein
MSTHKPITRYFNRKSTQRAERSDFLLSRHFGPVTFSTVTFRPCYILLLQPFDPVTFYNYAHSDPKWMDCSSTTKFLFSLEKLMVCHSVAP